MGGNEQVTDAADTGEDAILEQEKQLHARSAADIEHCMFR